MASDQSFVDFICDQIPLTGRLSSRKMFGEFAVYLDEKVVALICDNQLFVKPTAEGRALIGAPDEAPPYTGASAHFRVTEKLEDGAWLSSLFIVTAAALPVPKPKKSKPQK